jgi:hypothetical protein
VALRERGPTAIHGRRPRSGRVSDRETDPEIHPEEITFLTEKSHKFDPEAKDFLRTRLIGKQVRIGGCDNLMKLSNVKIYYSY